MLTCKQVARSLADRDYAELPLAQRAFLKMHVLLCFVCGRYHRRLMQFQDGVRRYRRSGATRSAPPAPSLRLRSAERDAIRRAVHQHAPGTGEDRDGA